MIKRWQFWLGLVISAVFLYIALKGMHIQEVWDVIKAAQFWWLIPSIAVYFLGVWATILALALPFKADKRDPYQETFSHGLHRLYGQQYLPDPRR